MAGNNSQPSNHMDTSQRINHVFGCQGETMHITPGFKLLQSPYPDRCPECGADVSDVTETPLGEAYKAFARIDLGEKPA